MDAPPVEAAHRATGEVELRHFACRQGAVPDRDVVDRARERRGHVLLVGADVSRDGVRERPADRLRDHADQGAVAVQPDVGARLGDRDISAQLASKLSLFKERGGVVGANSVGSLRGGKEPHVNAALALAGASLDHLPSAPEPVRPPEPDGGIDIPHDDTPPPAGA